MRKRPMLYIIREPETPLASNVVQINALRPSPRERAWRDLVRRLEPVHAVGHDPCRPPSFGTGRGAATQPEGVREGFPPKR